jgi:D-proline reductase (dithiol) PrdB
MPIDSYRFLDFATRQVVKAWVEREACAKRPVPWAPMAKPLARSTIALVTTAGVALRSDRPFDEERERRDPWWGDPTFRVLPHGVTEGDVGLHHLHIARCFGQEDLDVVLPARRLEELAREGVVGAAAEAHYSIMGYQLRGRVLEEETAPAIARDLAARGVDAVALVPA